MSTAGVTTFCLSLDPKADAYVGDIFGAPLAVEAAQKLPEWPQAERLAAEKERVNEYLLKQHPQV